MKINRNFLRILAVFVVGIYIVLNIGAAQSCFASGKGFSVSPMSSNATLNPGETYHGTFKISEPANGETSNYTISVRSYFVNENHVGMYGIDSDYSIMPNWITIDSPTKGTVAPNEIDEIAFTIQVPETAPAGGQYAAIIVTLDEPSEDTDGNGTALQEIMEIAHIIYAEVSGNTIRQGDIKDVSLNDFVLSGNIKGSAIIENTGNVHGNAKYTLQVFPIFSDEEVYTNEESPEVRAILPGRTLYNETIWNDTPLLGIFNVIYTVEFEGATAQISRLVIKCPVWLLFIIIFAIAAIIIYFISRAKSRKSRRKLAKTE